RRPCASSIARRAAAMLGARSRASAIAWLSVNSSAAPRWARRATHTTANAAARKRRISSPVMDYAERVTSTQSGPSGPVVWRSSDDLGDVRDLAGIWRGRQPLRFGPHGTARERADGRRYAGHRHRPDGRTAGAQ